jgi:hypothetical protein
MRVRRTLVALAVIAGIAGAATLAAATSKLPKPGSASQVAALVAASASIKSLPTNLLPPLSEASKDSPGTYDGVAGRTCAGVTKCVFGIKTSKRTIVLFGDSHAQMWLTALVPIAQRDRDRLVLVWMAGCPVANIGVWDASTHSVSAACTKFRSSMISQIKTLAPTVVLVADRTSDIPGAGNVLTTDAAWQSGLKNSLAQLKGPKTKVAVIGDITVYNVNPPSCLAAYPKAVQTCTIPNPNPKTHQHFAAEMAAAAAVGVPYVNPQPWLCTKTCSAVIGNMVAYYDAFHVTATYAEYLSVVLQAALKPDVGL